MDSAEAIPLMNGINQAAMWLILVNPLIYRTPI